MTYSPTQARAAETYVRAMQELCAESHDLTASAFRTRVTALTSTATHDLRAAAAYTAGAYDLAGDISAAHGQPSPPRFPPHAAPRPIAAPSTTPGSSLVTRPDYTDPGQNPLAAFLQRF